MESTITKDCEERSDRMAELKKEPADNDESTSEPQVITVEPTLPEFAFVKVEPEEPLNIECQPELENLQESDVVDPETTSPRHVTHKSPKTQVHFDFPVEVLVADESSVHQCTICNEAFSKKPELRRHLLVHSDRRDHRCDQCGKCFKTKDNMKQHKISHKPREHINCAYCDKTFARKNSLSAHINHSHKYETGSVRFVCTVCSKSYAFNSDLNRHQKTHVLQRCAICAMEFPGLRALRTHMRVAHGDEEKHECESCMKEFFILEDLIRHEKLHTSKLFKCDYCDKRYLTNDKLELHVKNHHSIVQYDCDICSKSFSCERYLIRHKFVHTKPLQCEVCNKAFSSKQQVQRHSAKFHSV